MKNSTKGLFFLFILVAAATVLTVSASHSEENGQTPARVAYPHNQRTYSFRYPETGYIVLPKNTEKIRFTVDNVVGVKLFNHRFGQKPGWIDGDVVAVGVGGTVTLSEKVEKYVFAMVTTIEKKDYYTECPMTTAEFLDKDGETIPLVTFENRTGWVSVGGGKKTDIVFCSHSPIFEFTPIIKPVSDYSTAGQPIDELWGKNLTAGPDGGVVFRYLSPFRLAVRVPSFTEEYRLSLHLTLCDNYAKGGEVYYRRFSPALTDSALSNTLWKVQRVNYRISSSLPGLPKLPRKTRKIELMLRETYPPADLRLLVFSSSQEPLPFFLVNRSMVQLVTSKTVELVPGLEINRDTTQVRSVFSFSYALPYNAATYDIDKNEAEWSISVTLSAFSHLQGNVEDFIKNGILEFIAKLENHTQVHLVNNLAKKPGEENEK